MRQQACIDRICFAFSRILTHLGLSFLGFIPEKNGFLKVVFDINLKYQKDVMSLSEEWFRCRSPAKLASFVDKNGDEHNPSSFYAVRINPEDARLILFYQFDDLSVDQLVGKAEVIQFTA